jgi:hypothetical protein
VLSLEDGRFYVPTIASTIAQPTLSSLNPRIHEGLRRYRLRSPKPVRSCSPRLGRFDSGAAPLGRNRLTAGGLGPRGSLHIPYSSLRKRDVQPPASRGAARLVTSREGAVELCVTCNPVFGPGV